jgi:ATP-dependent Lon protease
MTLDTMVPRAAGNNPGMRKGILNDLMGQMGGMGGGPNEEVTNLTKKLSEMQLPEEAKKIVDQEIQKVSRLSPSNQEYHVSLNYLTVMADLPWGVSDPE